MAQKKKKQQRIILAAQEWASQLSLRQKVIYAVGGVVGIGIVILIAITLSVSKQPIDDEDMNLTAEQIKRRDILVDQTQRDESIRGNAEAAIEQGDHMKASDVYKKAIEAEADTERKLKLTIDQSDVLYAAGKYDEAIKVMIEAEKLSSDKYLVADWLSRLYEDQDQYKLAAQYYTLAGEWAESSMNKSKLSKSYYDSQAARVSALVGSQ